MKLLSSILLTIVLITSCNRIPIVEGSRPTGHTYYSVTYDDSDNNTFDVTVLNPALGQANNLFQFAATAPGTYQTMNIGRFVRDFKAYDSKGNELGVSKRSVNQYELKDPTNTYRVQYSIAETWDTQVDEHKMYRMCGTSIEKDHLLFNAHCVLGYFKGLQAMPIQLDLKPVRDWSAGSALRKNEAGLYVAKHFDHLVDSPILMGRLSHTGMDVNGTKVEIYTYSITDRIISDQIMESMKDMLVSADQFLEGLPVDHYTFLFHFDKTSHGAWEHSYSSEYIYAERDWSQLEESIMATAAHEFFHVVTPLNIHSEIIEQFNFIEPTPSDHLWLYEGVTEWASDMLLLHGNLIDMQEFLNRHQSKLKRDEIYYDPEYSLLDLAKTSFTAKGHQQYGNIYSVGAVIASLLDLRILELSNGENSLRKLVVELANDYGPERPFNEDTFFEELVDRTYPEIEDFIQRYIKGTDELPVAEYYDHIGVEYHKEFVDPTKSALGITYRGSDSGIKVTKDSDRPETAAIKKDDIVSSINGVSVNRYTLPVFMKSFEQKPPGSSYEVKLKRNGKTEVITCQTITKADQHVLLPVSDASDDQLALRAKWLGN